MSHQLPPAEALAKWFHDTYVTLAPKHGHEMREEMTRAWDQIPPGNRHLMIDVLQHFCDEYGPTLAVARMVWDAAGFVWADWSIGKIDPVRMEALRQALIRYGETTGDSRPIDPVLRPYIDAAAVVRKALDDGTVDQSLVDRVLALGKHRSEDQRNGFCTR